MDEKKEKEGYKTDEVAKKCVRKQVKIEVRGF